MLIEFARLTVHPRDQMSPRMILVPESDYREVNLRSAYRNCTFRRGARFVFPKGIAKIYHF